MRIKPLSEDNTLKTLEQLGNPFLLDRFSSIQIYSTLFTKGSTKCHRSDKIYFAKVYEYIVSYTHLVLKAYFSGKINQFNQMKLVVQLMNISLVYSGKKLLG